PIQIDLEGLGKRIVQVPLPPGSYNRLEARKDKFFYLSTPIESAQPTIPGQTGPTNSLHVYDVTKRDDKVILSGIGNYALDKEGKKVIYRSSQDTMGIVDATPAPPKRVGDGRINTGELQVRVDPKEEWAEILHEAWRIERDYFWDPAIGGV